MKLRASMYEVGVNADCLILFGSHAQGRARPDSDIDIAVISRDFGHDRFAEGVLLNSVGAKICANMELIPIGLKEYLDPNSISPVLHEIKQSGTVLL